MGLIGKLFAGLFGGGRNIVAETAHVFRENTEAGAQRRASFDQAALAQYAAEFRHARKGIFDRFMDSLNRFPRPMFVLAIFWLFSLAVYDPLKFAEVMTLLDLVPTPLWYAAGTLMTFYFGGRMQTKMIEAKSEFGAVAKKLPAVLEQVKAIRALRHDSPGIADTGTDTELALDAVKPSENPAVQAWIDREKAQ